MGEHGRGQTVPQPVAAATSREPNWPRVGSAQQNQSSVSRGGRMFGKWSDGRGAESPAAA
jgi:hypothetical protein